MITIVTSHPDNDQRALDWLTEHGAIIEAEQRLGLTVIRLPETAVVNEWAFVEEFAITFDQEGTFGKPCVVVETALDVADVKLTFLDGSEDVEDEAF